MRLVDILARLVHTLHVLHIVALSFLDTRNHLNFVMAFQKVVRMGPVEVHMVVGVASKLAVPVLELDCTPVHFAGQVDEHILVVFLVPHVLSVPFALSVLFPFESPVAWLFPSPVLFPVPFLASLVLHMGIVGHVAR